MMKKMAFLNKSKLSKYQKVFGDRGKYNIFRIFSEQGDMMTGPN